MTTELDFLTQDFYKSISFERAVPPDFTLMKILFYGNGMMVNNSFNKPITFTVETFINAMKSQMAEGSIEQFMERELHAKTQVFGKVAHRISVYEYNFADHEMRNLPRGVNFIQFVKIEGHWRILSMSWSDENENHLIPEDWLTGQTE